jgi:hypothetical protein
MFEVVITMVNGRSRAISTSEIRKITAMRKNRNENGNRADLFGSKPHSNGDLFLSLQYFFFDNSDVNIIMAVVSVRVIITALVVTIIT